MPLLVTLVPFFTANDVLLNSVRHVITHGLLLTLSVRQVIYGLVSAHNMLVPLHVFYPGNRT